MANESLTHYDTYIHSLNFSEEDIRPLFYENMTENMRNHSLSSVELYNPPLSIIVLLSLLYGGISVAALIGNMLVLWVVSVSKKINGCTCFMQNL